MVDKTKVQVSVVDGPTGACLVMNHPDGPVLASVVLTDEIIRYLIANLPRHLTLGITTPFGMTGPH